MRFKIRKVKPKEEEVIDYIIKNLDHELTYDQFQRSIKHTTDNKILITDKDGYDIHIGLWHVYVEILQCEDLENTKENLEIVKHRIKVLEDRFKSKICERDF
ncbi:hypothetical protein [Paenibacillus amylolyticus]|uniref:hypothetical protein n=1 Tax=Paenibacillus amylolyticus TaxID=1451 RepID=UPI00344F7627